VASPSLRSWRNARATSRDSSSTSAARGRGQRPRIRAPVRAARVVLSAGGKAGGLQRHRSGHWFGIQAAPQATVRAVPLRAGALPPPARVAGRLAGAVLGDRGLAGRRARQRRPRRPGSPPPSRSPRRGRRRRAGRRDHRVFAPSGAPRPRTARWRS
jgi:hypothetical protein